MSIVPALGKQKHENLVQNAILGQTARPCLKEENQAWWDLLVIPNTQVEPEGTVFKVILGYTSF